ncbi:hypothetical protein ASD04_15675 [Devosia sp. Root436]|jgi:hypothetical protein|uniref:hypothetical protein n=1 Tax=Devosia sp. Root436 TaxID=1736537 RepID=UPI0006F3D370|nr:hypothetical protein [Devosia sp. Root436]KQX34827.1 hypothetical protein ASD04_15675 [Devosia sp. Root436]
MVALHRTRRFDKRVAALGSEERTRALKSLKQFLADPRHPSLHFEKLSGSDYRTIRVDMNFRIVMLQNFDGSFDLIDVDSHSTIYNKYG